MGITAARFAVGSPRLVKATGLIEIVDDFAPWLFLPAPVLLIAGLWRHSWPTFLAGLLGATTFGLVWGERFLRPPRPPAKATLKVMTFNVLAWNDDHAATAAAIADQDPDVVALQELSPAAAEYLVTVLGWRYPYRAIQSHPTPSGSGVFSKYELVDARSFKLSDAGHWSQAMTALTPLGEVSLFNVHTKIPRLDRRRIGPIQVPWRFCSEGRREEVENLLKMVQGLRPPHLVIGDFNMTERCADYLLMQRVLADAYATVGWGFGHSFPRPLSFPPALPILWPAVRLDYVWHSSELAADSAQVTPGGRSDHQAVVAALRRAGA